MDKITGNSPEGQAETQGVGAPALRADVAYYLRYARGERSMAQWDRFVGIWPKSVPLRQSPGFCRAANARKIARAYRLEMLTGKKHCHCHLGLFDKCPAKPENKAYWQRGRAALSLVGEAR